MKSLLILALFCVPAIAKAQCFYPLCEPIETNQRVTIQKSWSDKVHEEYMAKTAANAQNYAIAKAARDKAFYESLWAPKPQQPARRIQIQPMPMPGVPPIPGVRPLPGFQDYLNPGNPYSR